MQAESAAFIKLTMDVYRDFGFTDVEMKLSTRPENASVPTSCGIAPKQHWPQP
jgi:threonyl-tRNA synthetase